MANTNQKGRVVGIDYGLKRIGMAISDPTQLIANPTPTIEAARKLEVTIRRVVDQITFLSKEYGAVEEIVVGLPLMMTGRSSMLADEVYHFVDKLKEAIEIPIITWDERLTSVQADRSLREANLSRKKRSKVVDTVAATIILQNYLDSKRFSTA